MPIIATLLTATLVAFPAQQGRDIKNLEGKPLPKFTMTALDGRKITNATIKGRPVVIDFWATWCGPCRMVSPLMQEFHTKYAKKGLLVIGANGSEQQPGPGPAKAYAKEHGYTYLFTHSNSDLMNAWGVQGIPAMVFVNAKGKVVRVQVGYGNNLKSSLTATVQSLLKQ